jgi:hypothetical protein
MFSNSLYSSKYHLAPHSLTTQIANAHLGSGICCGL